MKAEELMIGFKVLVNGVPRVVQAVTKKKIGYHIEPNQSRMYYARLREVQPIPLNRDIASAFNEQAQDVAFMCWDDTCEACEHQYCIYCEGKELYARYLHELQLINKVMKIKFVI